MKKIFPTIIFILFIFAEVNAYQQSERISDKEIIERLIRLEEGQKYIKDEIKNVRTEMKQFMLWGFGITFAGIFALIGFVIWDRRSAIAPVQRESKHLAEEEETTRKILIEYSHIEPKMAKILKQFHLL
ncbi:MAG: hypothetical protein P9L89_00150 [Candidatus Celaenobacter polaris]|nr:hypothetical protein [Candidatus Celaenobacter polaris]